MRIIPGRFALWLHGITQVIAYILFIAAVGLGIWLVKEVRIPVAGGSLVSETHPSDARRLRCHLFTVRDK